MTKVIRPSVSAAAIGAALLIGGAAAAQDLSDSTIGYSIPVSGLEVIDNFAEMLEATTASSGEADFVIVSAEGDPLKQTTDVEALAAQGADAVVITAASDVGWDLAIQNAKAQGAVVVNHSGFAITGVDQNVMLDFYDSGYEVGAAAAAWLNETHDGAGQVGILAQSGDSGLAERSQGMRDGITENSDAEVVAEVDAYDRLEGAEGASNILAANPEVSVLLAFNDDVGLGALQAATEAGRTDPADLFIGGTDGLPDALTAIEDGTPYQATWGYMFGFSAILTMQDTEALLRGETVPPTRVQQGRLVTSDTLAEYREITADPFSDAAEPIFAEVSRYSDAVLSQGDATPAE
ncbi:sugar ABC transporter substrate-binding protein [Roseisalinus antarcticus]|uniref:D-ribose-binding periplasmic protein n=1 Tax=Roseisalinus antarcticus TaxID=254357 RepID=A0A1Y5RSQ3_9RHOB|nr:sugar ABC transporter substrate-binding protein [Roseisalinus antarcticus]SLN23273.1 D-ribose-binding periplasmic protein precursor [Roseisalinus antarcticus]